MSIEREGGFLDFRLQLLEGWFSFFRDGGHRRRVGFEGKMICLLIDTLSLKCCSPAEGWSALAGSHVSRSGAQERGLCKRQTANNQGPSKSVDFIPSAVGSYWRILCKGVTWFSSCSSEITLAAIWRNIFLGGERIEAERPLIRLFAVIQVTDDGLD